MSDYRLTILVPVYNEEESLQQFALEMDGYLEATTVPSQVLFVNDGSTDNSQQIIEEICAAKQHYRYVVLEQNCGLSTAVKAGIDVCQTELVGYIDSDIQTTPMDFLNYFEFFPGVRYGQRHSRQAKRQVGEALFFQVCQLV